MQTAVMSMFYITAVSGVLVGTGIAIRNQDIYGDVDSNTELVFAGSFLITFFWVCSAIAVFPCIANYAHISNFQCICKCVYTKLNYL